MYNDPQITFSVPVSDIQKDRLEYMLIYFFPDKEIELSTFSNAGLHVCIGNEKVIDKHQHPYVIPWLEFTMENLARKILGDRAPGQKKERKRHRPYYTKVMGDNFGKSHPIDFLYDKLMEKTSKNKS